MGDDGGVTEDEQDKRAALERQRRLAEIFGDVLPETTSDERSDGEDGERTERWYRENRPPHHG